jgi:hypothetical protein
MRKRIGGRFTVTVVMGKDVRTWSGTVTRADRVAFTMVGVREFTSVQHPEGAVQVPYADVRSIVQIG